MFQIEQVTHMSLFLLWAESILYILGRGEVMVCMHEGMHVFYVHWVYTCASGYSCPITLQSLVNVTYLHVYSKDWYTKHALWLEECDGQAALINMIWRHTFLTHFWKKHVLVSKEARGMRMKFKLLLFSYWDGSIQTKLSYHLQGVWCHIWCSKASYMYYRIQISEKLERLKNA